MSWIVFKTSNTNRLFKDSDIPVSMVYFSFKPGKANRDVEIYDYLIDVIKPKVKEAEGIIIPISFGGETDSFNTNGLDFALHLRLNHEMEQYRKMPIIILSNISETNILKYCSKLSVNNANQVLFTPGIEVIGFDVESVKNCIEHMSMISDEQYKEFLDKINIQRKISFGHHDIGNAWGCYKMSMLLGDQTLRSKIDGNDKISKYIKSLYAQYLISSNPNIHSQNEAQQIELKTVDVKNSGEKPRILYIDDKSDEGWSDIMSHIFRECDFHFVDSAKYKNHIFDFEGFYEECQKICKLKWDLVLIDLRLDPDKEDVDKSEIHPCSFSGFKLMNEMLKVNNGYQIMFVTASNKAWNVTELIKKGASGFFIKESPEFAESYQPSVLKYNFFIDNVNHCIKYSYLYDVYEAKDKLIKKVNNWDLLDELKIKSDIKDQIESSLSLYSKSISYFGSGEVDETGIGYAYQTLEFVFELISNGFVTQLTKNDKKNKSKFTFQFEDLIQKYYKLDDPDIKDCGFDYKQNSIVEKGVNFTAVPIEKELDNTKSKEVWVDGKPPVFIRMHNILTRCWNQDISKSNEAYEFIQFRNNNTHNGKSENKGKKAQDPESYKKLMDFFVKISDSWYNE